MMKYLTWILVFLIIILLILAGLFLYSSYRKTENQIDLTNSDLDYSLEYFGERSFEIANSGNYFSYRFLKIKPPYTLIQNEDLLNIEYSLGDVKIQVLFPVDSKMCKIRKINDSIAPWQNTSVDCSELISETSNSSKDIFVAYLFDIYDSKLSKSIVKDELVCEDGEIQCEFYKGSEIDISRNIKMFELPENKLIVIQGYAYKVL